MKDKYFESEDFITLLNTYTKATAQGGNIYLDAEDFCDVADYYLQQGKPEEAIAAADRGLRLHDDDELRIVKSSVLIYQHDYESAEKILDTCSDQKQSDVVYQRAQLQYALYNNVEVAEEMFHDWIAMEEESNRWEQDEYRREELARDCYIHIISSFIELVENHQYDEELVCRWIEDYLVTFAPIGNYDSDLILADTVREEGLLDMVLRVFSAILETNPYVNRGYAILASAQLASNDFSAAIESADYALAIDPDDVEAALTKAHAFMALENYEEAEKILSDYIEKKDDDSQAAALAYCYIYQDKDELAYEYLRRAEIFVQDKFLDVQMLPQAYGELAEGYLALEKADEAMRCIDAVIQLEPGNREAYFVRATTYLMKGDVETALNDFGTFVDGDAEVEIQSICMMFQRLLLFKYGEVVLSVMDVYESHYGEGEHIPEFLPYRAASLFQNDEANIQEFLDVLKKSCELQPRETKAVLGNLFPASLKPEDYHAYISTLVDKMLEKIGDLTEKMGGTEKN